MPKKTRQELEEYKSQWVADPIWDLEDDDDFKEYKVELLAFRFKMENKWKAEELKELNDKAASLGGVPHKLVTYLIGLEKKIEDLEERFELLKEATYNPK